jgi:hypothetical protein
VQPAPPPLPPTPRAGLGGITLLIVVLTPIIVCVIGAALCMGMGVIGSVMPHVIPSVSP